MGDGILVEESPGKNGVFDIAILSILYFGKI